MRYPNYEIMSSIMNFVSASCPAYTYYILIIDAGMLSENNHLYFYSLDNGTWVVDPYVAHIGLNPMDNQNLFVFQNENFIKTLKYMGGLKHVLLAREKILDLPFKLYFCDKEHAEISDIYMPHFGNGYHKIILLTW